MHTPGPWRIEERQYVHAICCVPTRKGEYPEVVFVERSATAFPGEPPQDLSAGSITAQQRTRKELAANARLIAAAPELLAACEAAKLALRATSQREKNYSYELGLLNAAIAKATA